MVSKQILQFKCVVSLYDQDFGAFCQERAPEGKKRFGEQPGPTKPVADELLEALVEAGTGFGGVEWVVWAALATLVAWGWLAGFRSLLGRLWWHWVFWLWTQCQNGGGGYRGGSVAPENPVGYAIAGRVRRCTSRHLGCCAAGPTDISYPDIVRQVHPDLDPPGSGPCTRYCQLAASF